MALASAPLCIHAEKTPNPFVSLETGNMNGAEVLLRWQRGDEIVSPAKFIPLAEEQGEIGEIGEWGRREAYRQSASWQQAWLPPFGLSINLSPRQLSCDSFSSVMRKVLQETELYPRWLQLELTETA